MFDDGACAVRAGVAAMFPLLACLQRMRVTDLDNSILNLSYPWLGLPIAVSRVIDTSHARDCAIRARARLAMHPVIRSVGLRIE